MTAPEPHPIAHQQSVTDQHKQSLSLQQVMHILTALSLFFVVMTPVVYFNGRSFHDGWYDYLHLDPAAFPLDTASMLAEGAIAWGSGLAELAAETSKVILAHWGWLLGVIFGIGLTWWAFGWLARRLNKERAKQSKKPNQRRAIGDLHPIKLILLRVLTIGFATAVICELIFGLTSAFAVLALPFYQLGKAEAKAAAATNFIKSPVVIVKSPKGEPLERRLIGCGPQFCALWGDGHASTVSLAAITWSDSPPPDR